MKIPFETKRKILRWVQKLLNFPPEQSFQVEHVIRPVQIVQIKKQYPVRIPLEHLEVFLASDIAHELLRNNCFSKTVEQIPFAMGEPENVITYKLEFLMPLEK